MREFDPMGRWEASYAKLGSPYCYGNVESYRVAASLLDGLPVVEDWGCGCAYAKQFFAHSKYIGVDGSKSEWCDIVDDLETRASSPDGILMRHVLEHNNRWKEVLTNALDRAQVRLVVVFFIDFGPETKWREDNQGIPLWQFSALDLRKLIAPRELQEIQVGTDTIWAIEMH